MATTSTSTSTSSSTSTSTSTSSTTTAPENIELIYGVTKKENLSGRIYIG